MKSNRFGNPVCGGRSMRAFVIGTIWVLLVAWMVTPDIIYAEEASDAKKAKPPAIESSERQGREAILGDAAPSTSASRWRGASRRERRARRDSARERWEDASPREQRIFRRRMGRLRLALPEFSEIERLVLVRNLFELSKEDQEAMRRRLRRMDDLDPSKRNELLRELRAMAADSSRESGRIKHNVDRWRGFSEAERDRYRKQMRRFRDLSTQDRRRLLDEWEDSPDGKKQAEHSPEVKP